MKKQQNKAIQTIVEGFEKLQADILKSDAKTIAGILEMVPHAVRPYLSGKVSDFNTGSAILVELKKLIAARERAAKKIAA